MALTLTPEQQTGLEAFDAAADDAAEAIRQTAESDAALVTAQNRADHDKQSSIDAQADALDKATAFIRLMIPFAPPPAAAKK